MIRRTGGEASELAGPSRSAAHSTACGCPAIVTCRRRSGSDVLAICCAPLAAGVPGATAPGPPAHPPVAAQMAVVSTLMNRFIALRVPR